MWVVWSQRKRQEGVENLIFCSILHLSTLHSADWQSTGWEPGPWFAPWRWRKERTGESAESAKREWRRRWLNSVFNQEWAVPSLPSLLSTKPTERLYKGLCCGEMSQYPVSGHLYVWEGNCIVTDDDPLVFDSLQLTNECSISGTMVQWNTVVNCLS